MIYVVGSLAYDFIMDYPGLFSEQINPDKLHVINLSFLVSSLRQSRGGTAGNIAYNLSLMNKVVPDSPLARVSLVGSLGKDYREYIQFFKKHRVATDLVHIDRSLYSARAYITTDKADNQLTGFYPGALNNDNKRKLPSLSSDDLVVISPTDPSAMNNHVEFCIKTNTRYVYDPGMQLPRLNDKELQRGVRNGFCVIGNDYEIGLINKRMDSSVEQLLLTNTKIQYCITTLAHRGADVVFRHPKNKSVITLHVPAVSVENVVDPTGAGDAFRAGLVAGFVREYPIDISAKLATVAASYVVSEFGTMNHQYTKKQFMARYKETFSETLI